MKNPYRLVIHRCILFLAILVLLLSMSACVVFTKKQVPIAIPEEKSWYLIFEENSKPVGWAMRIFEEDLREGFQGFRYFMEYSFRYKSEEGDPVVVESKKELIVDQRYALHEFRYEYKEGDRAISHEGITTPDKIVVRVNHDFGYEFPIEKPPFSEVYGEYLMHLSSTKQQPERRFLFFDVGSLQWVTRIISYLEEVPFNTNGKTIPLEKYLVEDKELKSLSFCFLDPQKRLYSSSMDRNLILKLSNQYDVSYWFDHAD